MLHHKCGERVSPACRWFELGGGGPPMPLQLSDYVGSRELILPVARPKLALILDRISLSRPDQVAGAGADQQPSYGFR